MGLGSRLVAIALFAVAGAAQAAKIADEDRTIVQVFDAPGLTGEQVFTGSRKWIAENFKSAKAVIEYENKDEGTIIGNGSIAYPWSSGWDAIGKADWKVQFTMKLESKDGRFRTTFTNVTLFWPTKVESGIKIQGYDGQVNNSKDMMKIRAKLLTFGPEIQKYLASGKADESW